MSIEQVQGKNEAEVLVREGNLVKSNKGFKVEVYSVNGFEYFDKEGIRYKIKGYSGKNKVIFEGAGVVQKVQKEPESTTPVDTNGTNSSDKEAKAEYRKSLLARAELLGLEFSKNTPTASLETLVVSAEKAKAESESDKAE